MKTERGAKKEEARISGPPLGRPPKNISKETKKRTARAEVSSALGRSKKQAQDDERFRNGIEGKFGEPVRWAGSPT